jgi:LPS-assembly protein
VLAVLPPFPLQRIRSSSQQALLLVGCLSAPQVLLAQQSPSRDAATQDWVSLDRLTDAQKAQIPQACCGLYLDPTAPSGNDPMVWDITGDKVNTGADGLTEIIGNLTAVQGLTQVKAERGTYREAAQTFSLTGGIQFRQPGLLLIGNSADLKQAEGTAEIKNASYLIHEVGAHGSADTIVFNDAQSSITIDNGTYTRCEPGDNAWYVKGSELELNQATGMGTAVDVTLRIKDIPVLYLPWVRFPISDKRVSGFLAPVLGSTRDGGLDVAAPYYLNLAPNYDATLTPRMQVERGVMLGVETRYLGPQWQQQLGFSLLPDDKLFNSRTAHLPLTSSPPQAERWSLDYNMAAALGHGWSAGVDYRSVSDEDYFQDFGKDGLNSTTQSFLYRSGSVNYRNQHWAFGASTQDVQLLDPAISPLSEPYRILPRLSLDGVYALPGGLEYGINSEYTYFDRDLNPTHLSVTDIAEGKLVTGSRLAVTPQISLPLGNAYSFVTPTVKYKYASWSLQDQGVGKTDNPSRGVASANIDSGLIFERDTKIGGSSFLQTLEPRLYYLYNEYEDQNDVPLFDTSELTFSFNQLFRDDRFSGKDRVGDANQLTASVTSRLYDAKGQEKASISLGQIQHFRDRRVTLLGVPGLPEQRSNSALTSELSYQLAENWRLRGYAEWNQHDKNLDVGNLQLQYQHEDDKVLNLAYRFRDMPGQTYVNGFDRRIKQSDVALHWPLSDTWNVVARWNYDYSNNRTLEGLAGVEYSNCCWNIRLVARQWIDNDALFYGIKDNNSGVFLQFELKGLGSILGGNVSSVLNNGIRGFRDRNNDRF